MKQDYPRDDMPEGCSWVVADMRPNSDGKLRQRGGWEHASANIASTTATASKVDAGIYASGSGGNLALDEDGRLYSIADAGTVTDIGAAVTVSQNPVFHRAKVIIPASGGATAPKYYDGATLGNLAGSPPNAVYATVWNDYTILARTSANTNRLWFSGAGDPTSWDTTNGWWEFTYPITGVASLRNAILVFHDGYVSRLKGAVPPPGGDMVADDPLWSVGCPQPFSIAYWRDSVIFANSEGIFITDGAGIADLTALCGMKKAWSATRATRIAAGVYRNYLFVSRTTLSTSTIVVDLIDHTWWTMTNIDARSYWAKQDSADELYWGRDGAAYVARTSEMFTDGADTSDGDGDAVLPSLETPYFRLGLGSKGWRRVHLLDELPAAVSEDPTVTVSYATAPRSTPSYTSLGSLAENSAEQYRSKAMGFSSQGVSLKLVRVGVGGPWRLNGIAADVHRREPSRS